MIYFSKDAEESFDKLLYYPYTIGKHIDKAITDVKNIMNALSSLPIVAPGVISRRTIRNIGTITYLSTPSSYFIQYISWSTTLTRFYYVKSNFIMFNSQGNIPSVHPILYVDRDESYFRCDNGFKVVSRYVTVRGKRTEVFNFKNLDGDIICDIDFTQVKPFDEYKDMTARGYTPNRRCYMVFEDGYKEEVNESKNIRLEKLINECVDRCLRKYVSNQRYINESNSNVDYPLYHNTSMENLISMMGSNSICSNYHRGYTKATTHNGICFTRSKTYNPYTYYDVLIKFDTRKLTLNQRGLRLIPYQDSEFEYTDEYEERLISTNGKPFVINNLSSIVDEVLIILDRTCSYINENGDDLNSYVNDLTDIYQNNIFGNKLKIVNNLKSMNEFQLEDACDYLEENCADDEYYNTYQVYCIEYFDVTDDSWEYSEYTQNRNDAINTAKQMYEDDGIPVRVTFGEYDGIDYERLSIVHQFGEID